MAAGCSQARSTNRSAPGKSADGAALGGINTPAAVNAMAIVGDGSQIAAGGADNLIRMWNIASATRNKWPTQPRAVAAFSGHAQPITSLANVPGMPARVLSGSADGSARLWNLADGKIIHKLDHGSPVTAVAVRPDGARFATAGAGGVAKLWNAADGKLLAEMRGEFRAHLQTACGGTDRRRSARATWRTLPRPCSRPKRQPLPKPKG